MFELQMYKYGVLLFFRNFILINDIGINVTVILYYIGSTQLPTLFSFFKLMFFGAISRISVKYMCVGISFVYYW